MMVTMVMRVMRVTRFMMVMRVMMVIRVMRVMRVIRLNKSVIIIMIKTFYKNDQDLLQKRTDRRAGDSRGNETMRNGCIMDM